MMSRQWISGGLILIWMFLLAGCAIRSIEPAAVLAKMTQVMSRLERAEFTGEFQVVGNSNIVLLQGLGDLSIAGKGKINLADANDLRYALDLIISGMGSEGKTEIDAELRSFPDYDYFRLTRILVPLGLPFSLTADNKWYKIKSESQNRSDIVGSSQPLTNEQFRQIREFLAQSRLFNLVQKFPDETVNGVRVYHWQVAMDAEMLRELIDKLNSVVPFTDAVTQNRWISMLSDYKYEFWISKYNYRLIQLETKGWYGNQDREQVDFTIKLNLSNFNSPQDIARPTNVQEFNLRQLLGLPITTP